MCASAAMKRGAINCADFERLHPVRAAQEQRYAELILQLAECLGNGGLGQADGLRSGADAPQPHDFGSSHGCGGG